jgi:hypothetical protein
LSVIVRAAQIVAAAPANQLAAVPGQPVGAVRAINGVVRHRFFTPNRRVARLAPQCFVKLHTAKSTASRLTQPIIYPDTCLISAEKPASKNPTINLSFNKNQPENNKE